ncbi:MAG: hypothetical protein JXB32_04475 [Deltaproteobacteria bacterium]|nr:hypothetical protein [Deltaproteobacteria bacterium]
MRNRLATVVAALVVLGTAAPAGASAFEIYIRGGGGFEYLDMTALDYSGALNPANYDTLPDSEQDVIDNMTKSYKGEGWAAGGSVGVLLVDFVELGVDFRQSGLTFDSGAEADLTQLVLHVGWHILGTELVADPSFLFGVGYSYLTTPGLTLDASRHAAVPGEEVTTNGFIGRAGAALDVRFVSWMSVGLLLDFSFLYFDAGEDTSWGFNTDLLGRISFHI